MPLGGLTPVHRQGLLQDTLGAAIAQGLGGSMHGGDTAFGATATLRLGATPTFSGNLASGQPR
jgi:hypothetical protein